MVNISFQFKLPRTILSLRKLFTPQRIVRLTQSRSGSLPTFQYQLFQRSIEPFLRIELFQILRPHQQL